MARARVHGYPMVSEFSEGEMAESQPHGGYANPSDDQNINGKGLEGEREHPTMTGHHNYETHRNRTLSRDAREPGGEEGEGSVRSGCTFRIPMRADIEES